MTVNGIVASEPQIKVANSGNTFVEFRMVNHDDKKEPFWYTCRSSYSNVVSLVKKYVKKGSRLSVIGDYSDEIYVNNQQVATISRNVWVTMVSFNSDGNSNNNNGNTPDRKSVV